LANTTFCWFPPDSRPTGVCTESVRIRSRRTSSAAAAVSLRRPGTGPYRPSAPELTWLTLSHNGLSSMSPIRARSPGTSATPDRTAPRSVRGPARPDGSRVRPLVSFRSPATISSTPEWPDPTLPAHPTISPRHARNVTPSSTPGTVTPPNRLRMRCAWYI
jgi:hypothetical protein